MSQSEDQLLTEMRELISTLCDFSLSAGECRRLEQLVCENQACGDYYVQAMHCHAALSRAWRPIDATSKSSGAIREGQLSAVATDQGTGAAPPWIVPGPQGGHGEIGQNPSPQTGGATFWGLLSFGVVASCLILGLGAYAVQVTRELRAAQEGAVDGLSADARIADSSLAAKPRSIATLVNVTNCRWDKSRSTADLQQQAVLGAGESLHLLEGVAEINSTLPGGAAATMQLEGPLAMMLTSEGMPNLLYGRLAGKFTCDFDQFTLDTPLGRVIVSDDASIGVGAAANAVELHVFSGAASLELWGLGLNGVPERLTAIAGKSLRAQVNSDGTVSISRGDARENWFVTPAAIAASQLPISPEYVAAIREAKPIAYWRFEEQVDGRVRNEIGDYWHCRMVGDAVRLRAGKGSSTVEFGLTAGPGYLVSDDRVDGRIGSDYSVEAWVKPTYFHHGALFSLMNWSPGESPVGKHRFHLELCGPISGYQNSIRPSELYPGRIRFINYAVDCFSDAPYVVRRWQHLASVKQGARMRLYADGRQVGTAQDPVVLGDGLRVLMGQLYPQNPHVADEVTSRLFVGELDEVALYDRVLARDEIERHVSLGRPPVEAKTEGNVGPTY